MEIDSIQTNNLEVGDTTVTDLSKYLSNDIIINGSFTFAKRATYKIDPTSTTEYNSLDRWRMRRANNRTCRVGQSVTDSPNAGTCLFVRRFSGDSFTDAFAVQQQVESDFIYGVRNKKLTISFYLMPETEWLTDWGTSSIKIATGTSLDESIVIGGTATGEVVLLQETIPAPDAADTWQKYTFTTDIVVPDDASTLYVKFLFGVSGTASADNALRMGEVKVEPGENATAYIPRPYSLELAMCQRYFQKNDDYYSNYSQFGASFTSGQTYYSGIQFVQEMRVSPTITITEVGEVGSGFNGISTGSISTSSRAAGFRWNVDCTTTTASPGSVSVSYEADAEI